MADNKQQDPRTVFVRGIDASIDDAQLQEVFSEVGPVKKAFLVRRGKDGPHRGFGFVQFAVQEDAARAAAELHGKEVAGRKLKVEGAVKRAPLEERKKRKQEAAAVGSHPQGQQQDNAGTPGAAGAAEQPVAKKPRPSRPALQAGPPGASDKHKWVRTVAVGGLTAEAVDAAVQLARRAGEVQEVIRPVPSQLAAQYKLQRDGCTGEGFLAVFPSVKQALAAIAKLHGQIIGSNTGKAEVKKGSKKGADGRVGDEPAAGACRVWARQLSGDGLHHKRWRLVVRNLPFTATEADLRQAFSPAGCVWELTVPRSAGGRGRGFAFVGFTCKADAERGIKLVNAQVVAGRPVAVDWAVPKAQYSSGQQAVQPAADGSSGPPPGDAAAELDMLDSDTDDEAGAAGRPSKLGHEEEGDGDAGGAAGGAGTEPGQERRMLAGIIDGILGAGGGEGPPAQGDLSSDSGQEDEEAEALQSGGEEEQPGPDSDVSDGSSSGSDHGDEQAGEAGEAATGGRQESAAAVDPFSRRQLQERAAAAAAAAQAGAQLPARREAEEGATVFVRGLPLDVSKEQLFNKMKAFGPVRSCRLVLDKASGKLKGTAFVDFYEKVSAEAAAEACAKGRRKEGPGVAVGGRVVDVDVAVSQQDARALSAAKAAERGPDRGSRRLALAKEGQIVEGSPAWEDMSAGDRAKRKRAAEEKKLKLRSPNFVVSDTRLSVRNIPPSWTEKQLKQAFIAAVRERASQAQPRVRQVKILMDEQRPGPNGEPRSKGIGFVEFTEHEHALCALRQLNNNPTTFSKDRRPIVEFALENVKALKLREVKLVKSQQQPDRQQQLAAAGQPGTAPVPAAAVDGGEQGAAVSAAEQLQAKSKRQVRKERRLMLRERRKQQQQQQQQQQGDSQGHPDEAGQEGNAAAAAKTRSAKRRELRKRKQGTQQEAATTSPATANGNPTRHQGSGDRQPAAGVNSRAARGAAALREERLAQHRKRSVDDVIDRLADSPQGELRSTKQRKREQTDSVDQLAKQYLDKYFAGQPGEKAAKGRHSSAGNTAGALASQRAALKRWFE